MDGDKKQKKPGPQLLDFWPEVVWGSLFYLAVMYSVDDDRALLSMALLMSVVCIWNARFTYKLIKKYPQFEPDVDSKMYWKFALGLLLIPIASASVLWGSINRILH